MIPITKDLQIPEYDLVFLRTERRFCKRERRRRGHRTQGENQLRTISGIPHHFEDMNGLPASTLTTGQPVE